MIRSGNSARFTPNEVEKFRPVGLDLGGPPIVRLEIQGVVGRRLQEWDAHRPDEGDLLPGLVIDRYADFFTIQTLDQGIDRAKADIVSCLEELFSPRGVVERNDVSVRKHEGLPLVTGVVAGEVPESVEIAMNGLTLQADLQRPGFGKTERFPQSAG